MTQCLRRVVVASLFSLAWVLPVPAQTPQGTTFTYQGRLGDGGAPANGAYDFQFILYNAAVGGSQVGPIVTRDDVAVSAGLFVVGLDFGAAFAGSRRWLEISVRPGASSGAYTPILPRQELTPAPSTLFSAAAPWTGISGKPAGFADDVDNDSGGDITSVSAGAGLTGGGATGDVGLGVLFAGTGAANVAARADHHHFGMSWSGAGVGLELVSSTGDAIVGRSTATSGFTEGVYGESASSNSAAIAGVNTATAPLSFSAWGVLGRTSSTVGRGVFGEATAASGANFGVVGESDSSAGRGVLGFAGAAAGTNYGIYGATLSPSGYAGYFDGRVHVQGTLSKAAGSFKIDHPLDPENKYLYHSFVESPDMMNVYNGNVTTDERGYATVALPDWFEALNRDFRYQLTVLDEGDSSTFVQAKVVRKIAANRFTIRTSLPRTEVSWQVTGIRHDPYAEKHRIPIEEDKSPGDRGKYLHAEAWGVPAEKSLLFEDRRALREERERRRR